MTTGNNHNQTSPATAESLQAVPTGSVTKVFLAVDTAAALIDKSNCIKCDPIKLQAAMDAGKNNFHFGSGKASGNKRAEQAAELALSVFFSTADDYGTAAFATIYIHGSPDMTMHEYDVVTRMILVKLPETASVLIIMFSVGTWQDCIQAAIELNGAN